MGEGKSLLVGPDERRTKEGGQREERSGRRKREGGKEKGGSKLTFVRFEIALSVSDNDSTIESLFGSGSMKHEEDTRFG